MTYYPTITEDVQRAKDIIERGRATVPDPEDRPAWMTAHHFEQLQAGAGTIYGADIYAAYRLLQSFVDAIECVGVDIVKTALRARELAEREPR